MYLIKTFKFYVICVGFSVATILIIFLYTQTDARKSQKLQEFANAPEVVLDVYEFRYYEGRAWFKVGLKNGGYISFVGLDSSSFSGRGRIAIDEISGVEIGCKRTNLGETVLVSYAFNLGAFLLDGVGFELTYKYVVENHDHILNRLRKLPVGSNASDRYFFPSLYDDVLGGCIVLGWVKGVVYGSSTKGAATNDYSFLTL